MEKEKKSEAAGDTDFVLQWGSTKRLRCVKVKKVQNSGNKSKLNDSLPKKKLTSRAVATEKDFPSRLIKNSDLLSNNRKSSVLSPDKEDRYYTTRGSMGLDDNSKILMDNVKEEKVVWPRLFIALSNKEKEEDFMAMKGCKPPQRPKKRAKLIQRTLLLVSPGAWLSDLCHERYEVREKKTSKKRPRGLKAMGSMESDSE
ncbi:PREDICTED: uncharacterized protein LOC105142309 [Populus euphratica]|uniref:Uncharacterized protein LOC105142309 n=1 Tax=Populus euphratica TaxID=75702 RepID=A0AAJ6VGW1_POPEU|nr:PREDICTED: uncharacterized protein LOC105142309 [Populus euphratica]XP_011048183.1 PREDICTED: uncharacterized protein LOC105142309 [Populus euphratica]